MRRWETWLALLLVVGLSRLRATAQSKRERPVVGAYERAPRVQEARERKSRRWPDMPWAFHPAFISAG
ncbi:MAG: hypothetical protein ACYDGM_01160 [Vulcanimicrobiaceae bacterium]